jgi:hypothetical protein
LAAIGTERNIASVLKLFGMTKKEKLNFRIENVTPILRVSDMIQSLAFYIDILGFKKADWGDDSFKSISKDNSGLYLCKGGQSVSGTWIWIGVIGK